MKRYALLGRKISYSRSPLIHAYLARETGIDIEYGLYQTEDPSSIFEQGLDGFNITIPYKQALLDSLSSLDPIALRVGAVNTVSRVDGGWKGFNTDYSGFLSLLERAGIEVAGNCFSILGSGGAARGAALALMDSGAARVRVFSRSAEPASMELTDASGLARHVEILPYSRLQELPPSVIVNATPLGTEPNQENPLPSEGYEKCLAAVDLVYNPFLSPFLREAVSRGIPSADGLDMLAVQAMRAFEIWQGIRLGRELEDRTLRMLRLRSAAGIALVGMPLSGKSTLLASLALSDRQGLRVADLDDEIVKDAGKDIPAIFATEGEGGFRSREHEILGRLTGAPHIIACGGGALTRKENLGLLRHSLIVYLDLDLDELKQRFLRSKPGSRPLLKSEADLEPLFKKRLPVYLSASRERLKPEAALDLIKQWLEVRDAR